MRLKDISGALPHKKKEEKRKDGIQLTTVWGESIDPEHVWEEYPRPHMVRKQYTVLNGLWTYAITKTPHRPTQFDGQILVPFSPEAPLSGVNRQLLPDEYLWYERSVEFPIDPAGKRCLLHFEAADQCASVFINGVRVIRHVGGYLPFEADITRYIKRQSGSFVITVCIQDFSDTSYHSRGKQKLSPGGMYYTAQSGIWQSVWMEFVPERYIEDIISEPDAETSKLRIKLKISDSAEEPDAGQDTGSGQTAAGIQSVQGRIRVFAPTRYFLVEKEPEGPVIAEKSFTGAAAEIYIPEERLWSPQNPWIYPAEIRAGEDLVRTYFSFRSYEKKRDDAGIMRLFLNGEEIFLNGVLDQGYWPDGLYTAPADAALIYDIEQMKALGFQMLRKHAKIENRRWYYHCDRIGMIVWQDMVNGGEAYSAFLLTYLPTGICVPGPLMKKEKPVLRKPMRKKPSFSERLEYRITGRKNAVGRAEFKSECGRTIDLLKRYPSIMTWVLFNEGWGQFETKALTQYLRRKDPGRLVDSASGWFEHKTGDFKSVHNYFRKMFVPADVRINVLSEYGGYVYPVPGHSMFESTYGYHTCGSAEEFEESFKHLLKDEVLPLQEKGLCGAVYTQVSDIEEETNGLLTYDRKVCKIKDFS